MLKRILQKFRLRLFPPEQPDVFMRYDPERNPEPGEVRDYYDRFLEHSRHYDADNPPTRFVEAFQALEPHVAPGMRVLDLGCGTGISTAWLAGRGADVLGVDLSPRTIAFAREQRRGCAFQSADATELRLERKFDLIVMIDMLEHILPHRREALWDSVARHCAPGARVFISVPDAGHVAAARARGGRDLQIVDEPVPVEEITGAFARRGFEIVAKQQLSLHAKNDANQLMFRLAP